MKAAMYRGVGQIAIEEIEKPAIQADEYLVEVLCSGLCGTDIKTFKQGHRMFTPPCVLGHEFCGRIVETGADMDSSLLGKKVVCAPYIGCGHCDLCRDGLEELCYDKIGTSGAFTEYLVVDKALANGGMVVLDEDADIRQMTMAEPLACIINSIEKSKVQMGQNVLVIGAGPMGLIHIEALKLYGARKIIVTEMNENRQAVAAKMDAIVINPALCNVKEELDRVLQGERLNHIFVCVGAPQVVEDAYALAKEGTTINIFGGLKSGSTITIDPNVIHYSEVTMLGSFGFSSKDFLTAAKLLSSGKVNLAQIISDTYHLDDAALAFERAAQGDVLKILIEMK